ncbi:MAG: D-alanyl-D-alanine carboxypeptidase/D-alanyl-D-alanine-endopeptidase [Solirubrobacteraceae bacterium]
MLTCIAITGCGASARAHRRRPLPPAPVAAVPVRAMPVPSAVLRLRAKLERVWRLAGPASGAAVYDLTTHTPLFGLRDADKRAPASIEKLYTSVALLRRLGANARLRTTVLGAGHLGRDGVWHGDLYLRGGGDPTFGDAGFNRIFELGYGATQAQLTEQLAGAGIRRVSGAVVGDESLFDARRGGPASAYAPDIPDFGGELSALSSDHGASGRLAPPAFAANQLALTMRRAGIRTVASALSGITPPGARRLAVVSSPPLSVLLKLMNVPSDDLFAELLTKQLGARFADAGSTEAGAGVIADAIREGYGLYPRIRDGSGLSRTDGSSPREVLDLLRSVWRTPVGHVLSASLPIVGITGTVRRIARGTPAEGRCSAKTGTLNGVTNLAGYCTGRGHHTVAFALFDDGLSERRSLALEGRMIATIAGS